MALKHCHIVNVLISVNTVINELSGQAYNGIPEVWMCDLYRTVLIKCFKILINSNNTMVSYDQSYNTHCVQPLK